MARFERAASAALFRQGFLIAALWLLPAAGWAAPADLPSMLERCAAIDSDAQRLACYDGLSGSLSSTGAGQTPPHSDGSVGGDGFGLRKPLPPPTREDAKAQAITSSIEEIRRRPRGEHIFVLTNGQVWTELEVGRSRYREGMEVTIERTLLGAYMLSTPGGRAARVRRIE
jgi:hypothetical protein